MLKSNKLLIKSRRLKDKLSIAFCLIFVLPFLVVIYLLANYVFPQTGITFQIMLFLLSSVFIAGIGVLLINQIINRFLIVTTDAQVISSGNINHAVSMAPLDEVGILGETLNQLTSRIRSNMEELESYSQKTSEINLNIQQHVFVFTHLLQISSLISQGVTLDAVLKLVTEKARFLADSEISYLFFKDELEETLYMRSAEGKNYQGLFKITMGSSEPLFEALIKSGKQLCLDKDNVWPDQVASDFYERFQVKNTLALPVYVKGNLVGILGVGNSKDNFSYSKDDVELLDIFTKQIAIAVEHERLIQRVEKLEVKDTLTGLYNKTYILIRLQEEIRRAIVRQRPCSLVLLNIDDFVKYRSLVDAAAVDEQLKKIAYLIRDSVTEIDRVARFDDNEFAIVFPEKNKRQAQEIAEGIRENLEKSFKQESDTNRRLTVSGGLSENPLDGSTAEELLSKAEELLAQAKKQGKNRILV
ncbi:MAG: sensor domain-containing diguanylate cyclase [Candidatus Omnitrophota bacterium]